MIHEAFTNYKKLQIEEKKLNYQQKNERIHK